MAFDIQLVWDNTTGFAQWVLQDGGLSTGSDLETSVILSLFTDKAAPSDYVPVSGDVSFDRRGHFSDTYTGKQRGSWLWLLNRGVFSASTNLVLLARDYCKDALQWLIDDGVAAAINVQVQRSTPTTLAIQIIITEPKTFRKTAFQYSYVWNQAI